MELVAREPGRGTQQCYDSDPHRQALATSDQSSSATRPWAETKLQRVSTQHAPGPPKGGRSGPLGRDKPLSRGSPNTHAQQGSRQGPRAKPRASPTTPIPKDCEPGPRHAQYPRGTTGPATCPCQVQVEHVRHKFPRRTQDPAGDSHPSVGPRAETPTQAGIGPKVVPDSFRRKGNSANPPPVTTRPSRGGPRCTAFPRGPTTRTRRSSVIRRRAARLVMARVATYPSTRTRHTSGTGPNDVSGDSDTLHRPTAQPTANRAPETRNRAHAAELPPVDQTRPGTTNLARQGAPGPDTITKPDPDSERPKASVQGHMVRIFHETT